MDRSTRSLDRHALVMAIWLAFGFVGLVLFDRGLGAGGVPAIAAAFGMVLAAFAGHIVVNAAYGTTFTRGELALGLVLYATGLVALGVATLFSPDFATRHFLAFSLGFLAVFAGVIFYMVTHFGVRRVFTAFDAIRDFRPHGGDTP